MPFLGLLVSRLFKLPAVLAAGVVLVGCCPGGTASNLVTLLAGADVALSVTMTAVSTITAGVMTPLLTSRLLGSLVPVDTKSLISTTIQVRRRGAAPGSGSVALKCRVHRWCSRPFLSACWRGSTCPS
jgi:bile acid:Na+ symporter, BASS family